MQRMGAGDNTRTTDAGADFDDGWGSGSPDNSGDDTPKSALDSIENPLSSNGSSGRRRSLRNSQGQTVSGAGQAVVDGFGSPDGRRPRVPVMALVADAARDVAASKEAKRSFSSASHSIGTSGTSSFGSVVSDGERKSARSSLNRGEQKARGETLTRQSSSFRNPNS